MSVTVEFKTGNRRVLEYSYAHCWIIQTRVFGSVRLLVRAKLYACCWVVLFACGANSNSTKLATDPYLDHEIERSASSQPKVNDPLNVSSKSRSELDFLKIQDLLEEREFVFGGGDESLAVCKDVLVALRKADVRLVKPIVETSNPEDPSFERLNRCRSFEDWPAGVANSNQAFFGMRAFADEYFELYELDATQPFIMGVSKRFDQFGSSNGGYAFVDQSKCVI